MFDQCCIHETVHWRCLFVCVMSNHSRVLVGSLQGPLWAACVSLVNMRSGVVPCGDDSIREAVSAVQDECGDEPVVLVLLEELNSALRHGVSLEF
jgi:hypothetical protein